MKRIDVLYFIEHTAREMDVASAVKYLCESQWDLNLHIASFHHHTFDVIRKYNPNVVALPFIRYVDVDPYMRVMLKAWPNALYFDLSYEQMLSPLNQAYKAPRTNFVKKEVFHHAWGDFFREYLYKHGVTKSHIIVNGNPTYALYNTPYCQVYPSRDSLSHKFGLRSDRPWFLFPENYPWVFYPEHYLKNYIRRGLSEKDVRERYVFERKSIEEIVRWWDRIAKEIDCEVIIRSRPAIDREKHLQLFQEILKSIPPNLHIIKEGPIQQWVLHSDAVFSSNSSTLLDASISEKPAYIVEPYAHPNWLVPEWHDLLPHLTSYSDLHKVCSSPMNPLVSASVKDYVRFHMLPSEDPINGLANAIHVLHARTHEKFATPNRKPESQSKLSIPFQITNRFLKTRKKIGRFYWSSIKKAPRMHEKDDFSQEDVDVLYQRWREIL